MSSRIEITATLKDSYLSEEEIARAEQRYVEELIKSYGSLDGVHAAYSRCLMVMWQSQHDDTSSAAMPENHPAIRDWDEKNNHARAEALGKDLGEAYFEVAITELVPAAQGSDVRCQGSDDSDQESEGNQTLH